MVRFLIFFVSVFLLTGFLSQLPVVGALFRIPFLGFWFTAILLSALLARVGTQAVDAGRRRSLERSLGAVDTAHHKGKLAGLHLSQGRHRKALPLFRAAMEMDPESLEWRYGFARAAGRSGAGERQEALAVLDGLLELDEEHAYGEAMLLSAGLHLSAGDHAAAAQRVERFDRNHGPSPESALLRGQVARATGDRAAAKAAWDSAADLLRTQRAGARQAGLGFRLRLLLARLGA